MQVSVAKTAGFCFGVARALKTVHDNSGTKKLCVYGQLIHNKSVTDGLAAMGVREIEDLALAGAGETVVIRSHGVPEAVYDEIKDRGLLYIDCTCTYVKKIHRIAAEARDSGKTLVVVGDAAHPEVAGIVGYGGQCAVVGNMDELKGLSFETGGRYVVVVQTTYEKERFCEIASYLRGIQNLAAGPDIEIHDTICMSTAERQEEARVMSGESDVMIVLGDARSSNAAKLASICRRNCPRTYLLEGISEIKLNILKSDDRIGLIAGASTPPAVIKEALGFMSDLINANNNQTFEEMLDDSLVSLHTGDVVKGTVIQVTPGEISVNLGYKSDGIIPKNEITDDANCDITEMIKPGEEVIVYVVRVNDGEGNVMLSKKKIDAQKSYTELENAFQNQTPIEGKIIDQVKGGLIAAINGMRVFIPSSQISNRYVEDIGVYKGQSMNFNILEFNTSKRRIVAGRKELAQKEQDQRREQFFAEASIGQKLTGKVSRVANFGAFVDLGGVDGLIHITELGWSRVRKVSDVLSEGDTVEVTVIGMDAEKGKISLTLKDVENNPWNNIAEKYPAGQIVTGAVVRLVPFGAFVQLEDGVDGLIHISQISSKRIAKPEDELTVGQIVDVMVLDVKPENKRISLSKKAADGVLTEAAEEEAFIPVVEAFDAENAVTEETPVLEEDVLEETESEAADSMETPDEEGQAAAEEEPAAVCDIIPEEPVETEGAGGEELTGIEEVTVKEEPVAAEETEPIIIEDAVDDEDELADISDMIAGEEPEEDEGTPEDN